MTSLLSATPAPPRSALSWLDFIVAAFFFFAALFFLTRHNDFPAYYHPDEPGKVRQLMTNEYNFNHPLLLLQTSRIMAWTLSAGDSTQKTVEAGRLTSALFSAAAIACLVLAASSLQGTIAGIGTGLLLLFNPHVFELAHYMKEDPAYAFGVTAFLLAVIWFWIRPGLGTLVFLGVGAGLALSGKYLGAILLPVGIWCAWEAPGYRKRNVTVFLGAVIAITLLINFPMWNGFSTFSGSFGREMEYAVHGHRGITRSVPHGVYGAVFRQATNPLIWILLGVYAYALIRDLVRQERKLTRGELVLAAFPLFYAILLSFFPKTHHRYFLPATMVLCCLAGMGAARFRLYKFPIGIVLLFAGVLFSAQVTAKSYAAFQADGRSKLVSYVLNNIPHDAIIVQDSRVSLPNRNDVRYAEESVQLDQKIISKLFAADAGTIEELRAQGVRYVVVSEGAYQRFFLPSQRPNPEEAAEYHRCRAFYEQLFREGTLLWSCPAGRIPYLEPSLKFYSIDPKK